MIGGLTSLPIEAKGPEADGYVLACFFLNDALSSAWNSSSFNLFQGCQKKNHQGIGCMGSPNGF